MPLVIAYSAGRPQLSRVIPGDATLLNSAKWLFDRLNFEMSSIIFIVDDDDVVVSGYKEKEATSLVAPDYKEEVATSLVCPWRHSADCKGFGRDHWKC